MVMFVPIIYTEAAPPTPALNSSVLPADAVATPVTSNVPLPGVPATTDTMSPVVKVTPPVFDRVNVFEFNFIVLPVLSTTRGRNIPSTRLNEIAMAGYYDR